MKKYLLVLFLVIFIIPSIAFASWWNPFSWFSSPLTTNTTTVTAPTSSPVVPSVIPASTITPPKPVASSGKKVAKTDNQICIEQYGEHNYSTGVKNSTGGLTCQCENNYTWNGKQCIPVLPKTILPVIPVSTSTPPAITETGYQVCSNAYPDETWDGTYTSNGKYNCVCITGYVSNSAGTACVSESSSKLATLQSQLQMYQNELSSGQADVQKYKDQWNSQNCSNAESLSLSGDRGQLAITAQTQVANCAIIMQAENDTYNVEVAPIQNDIVYIQQEISNLGQ